MTKSAADPKERVYRFITKNRAAALATVGKDGVPHVATVFSVVFKDLSVYFMTRVEARKYANILQQPKVAMAFTNEAELTTVQLTGMAERVEDLELENQIWGDLMRFRLPLTDQGALPTIQMYERGATNELAIIKVTPYELSYANFVQNKKGRFQTFFEKII